MLDEAGHATAAAFALALEYEVATVHPPDKIHDRRDVGAAGAPNVVE
jgi:hypothetical protein